MTMTAAEQYLIELINAARLDPLAEAERYDLNLNSGLAAGTIGTEPLQVLAPNVALHAAAETHSAWMIENNVFSHTGENSSSPGARMVNAGYDFEGQWGWSENLAWVGSTGSIDLAEAIESHHEGLYRSPGHRVNTFGVDVREIGVAQAQGTFESDGTSYNSSILTEQFAVSGSTVFVTGVAYTDTDDDQFYSIGEGQEGVWFHAEGTAASTAQAGGYALGITGAADTVVEIGVGDTTLGVVTVDMTQGKVKVDLVTDTGGDYALALSGSTVLGDGIDNASLLGAGDLDLSGNSAANDLAGNSGNNLLFGGGGADIITGGSGSDRLNGGATGDRLYGEGGRDVLIGGHGYDRLYGGGYHDRLYGGTGNDLRHGGGGNDRL